MNLTVKQNTLVQEFFFGRKAPGTTRIETVFLSDSDIFILKETSSNEACTFFFEKILFKKSFTKKHLKAILVTFA